jgi:hypothetical protein
VGHPGSPRQAHSAEIVRFHQNGGLTCLSDEAAGQTNVANGGESPDMPAVPEMTERERVCAALFEGILRTKSSMDEAIAELRLLLNDDALADRVIAIRERDLTALDSWPPPNSICGTEHFTSWYSGVQGSDRFWPDLAKMLIADPRWADAVPSIDEQSHQIVRLLGDPRVDGFRRQGLVLGHVQSGKTANFTATIAKAADAGYRLFIVLAGVHNSLRTQTQERLDKQLVELNPGDWVPLTASGTDGDFAASVPLRPLVSTGSSKVLLVVKKERSRLESLRDWLARANEAESLNRLPVLVIDDESDQAGVNTAPEPETDRTTINGLITEVLLQCPRLTYVAYTATPFANLLINPGDRNDLFPRDFVYALPKPVGYFGSEELFGSRASEEDEDGDSTGHNMIRIIDEAEASVHQRQPGAVFAPSITPSLDAAIRWLVLATAARRVRSGHSAHSSMLVHADWQTQPHFQYQDLISDHLEHLRGEWLSGSQDAWRSQWLAETDLEPAEAHGLRPIGFNELADEVTSVLEDVRVLVENSSSGERLLYTDDPVTVIAIGGNTLSRGLTVEGLVSSFFTRGAKQSDTLLQMGRWFGYRPGYADLPRIWTTKSLAADFKFLSQLESDLRREIQLMIEEGSTPESVPIRMLAHPHLHLTRPSAMRFAVRGSASYGGKYPQTVLFRHDDRAELRANQDAARLFLRRAVDAGASVKQSVSRVVVRDVPVELVIDFIQAYRFHPNAETNPRLLTDYIDSQLKHDALRMWNVVVVTRRPDAGGGTPSLDLGLGFDVPLITRAKLRPNDGRSSSTSDTADIKGLISQPDRIADLIEEGVPDPGSNLGRIKTRTDSGRAVLLLYPIDKDSTPTRPTNLNRVPLGAADHVIGLAISFPEAHKDTQFVETLMVNLELVDAEGFNGGTDFGSDGHE